ncbi:MAG: transglycosylase domain-containing protein [Cyclobacteriaceae bacterium]|jgi:penicillin-binding protein 1A
MKKHLSKIIPILWVVFVLGVLSAPAFIYSVRVDLFGLYGGLPSLQDLEKPDPELSSELYSADGLLLGKYFRHNRTPVNYRELSPKLIETLLVTEDIRYTEHSGIDFRGLGRVLVYSLLLGENAGGGSTITQQLAKNLFRTRTDQFKGTLSNVPGLRMLIVKVKEWIVAVRLEKFYTKEEIMAMYLNTAEYGSNSYGIRVAAQTYFNKLPSELGYNESAILVGLLNKPTRYNPVYNPEFAKEKRQEVLYNLQKYNRISTEEFDSLKTADFGLQYQVAGHNEGPATYFRSVIRNFLMDWCAEHGYDLFDDGLKIYTTIDSRMQSYAELAVEEHMSALQKIFDEHWEGRNPWIDTDGKEIPNFVEQAIKRTDIYRGLVEQYGEDSDSIDVILNRPKPMTVFSWDGEKDTIMSPVDSLKYYKRFLQAGFMSMDPHSGHIKAWVGGIDHKYFKYDHVKQGRRQPGSTFKPFVYTAAIDNGYSPCYPVIDAPVVFDMPGQNPPFWQPDNAEGRWSGETMTIRRAMASSVNSITAFMMKKVSPETVVNYAKQMGITSPLEAVPSLCLGAGGDVSIFELVGAYSTFVNKGVWTEPTFITRIEDENGAVLQEFVPKKVEALNEETAYLMLHMLKGATEEEDGTGRGLSWELKSENEIGAKTGTTQNASDGWFMGVTKDLVSGSWVGGDDRSIHFRSWVLGQGARTAMPIWSKYMTSVYADKDLGITKGPFDQPMRELSIEIDCDLYDQTSVTDTLNINFDNINEDDIF